MDFRVRNVIIIGCGRLGALLADTLSVGLCRVTIIDKDTEAFKLLGAEFSGFRLTGDATELQVLKEAGIAEAECILAVTEKDTVNLMVTQVAKTIFSVEHVLARVYDPRREALYRDFGVQTISPTSLIAEHFLSPLRTEQTS